MPNSRSKKSTTQRDPELVALGRRIKAARKEVGLSQEALADAAGLHWTAVSRVERGERNITYRTLRALARGLGVPLSSLMPND
jgi:transcriptional regulator with XRE-family HTH domain